MRVALHTGQLQAAVPGGIGRYVEGLLAHLPSAEVEIAPFTGSRWQYQAWHRLRWPAPPVTASADLVHAPSLAVPPGRKPLVVTVHDLAFRTHPECFPARGRAFHERGLEIARQRAAAIVVPSAFTGEELVLDAGFPAERIHVVPHGIDPLIDPDPADGARRLARFGLAETQFLLAVGTVEPRKGLEVAVAALDQLRSRPGLGDLRLVVAGPDGWGDVPDLDHPGVIRPGRVPEGDLDALYRGAAAVIAASKTEGFGLPALEAMARGCVPVAGAAGSLPEVVGDAGLLVPPGDSTRFADAVATLLDDPARQAALSAAGLARAATFTWAACVEGHRKAYEAALGAE